ncbi:hypothetical protein NN561_015907 [Cricetulus griseus]
MHGAHPGRRRCGECVEGVTTGFSLVLNPALAPRASVLFPRATGAFFPGEGAVLLRALVTRLSRMGGYAGGLLAGTVPNASRFLASLVHALVS